MSNPEDKSLEALQKICRLSDKEIDGMPEDVLGCLLANLTRKADSCEMEEVLAKWEELITVAPRHRDGGKATQEVVFPDGMSIPAIPYNPGEDWGDGPCHDCGTLPGELHSPGCDMERCPSCREQFIMCWCLEADTWPLLLRKYAHGMRLKSVLDEYSRQAYIKEDRERRNREVD